MHPERLTLSKVHIFVFVPDEKMKKRLFDKGAFCQRNFSCVAAIRKVLRKPHRDNIGFGQAVRGASICRL